LSGIVTGLPAVSTDTKPARPWFEKTVPGTPRVILALANHGHTTGWDRAKVLQHAMFEAASARPHLGPR
jgi:hypothetical protein